METLLINVTEAQRTLGVSRNTLYRMMDAGTIRSVRIGSRRMFVAASLREYVENLANEAAAEQDALATA